MDKLEAMRVFCNVIEAGSFAGAADRIGMSTTAVSRYVAQLESHLNVRLINRTTRRMSPTDEGYAYFERCTQLLADMEETEAVISGEAHQPRGRLRVTAPIALATLQLAPAFAAFSKAYPDISLDIVLSDYISNFAEDGLDVAIRVGKVGSDNLVARHISDTSLMLAASPDYIAQHGAPQHPDELHEHTCLTYTYSANGNQCQFENPAGEPITVRLHGPINSNNGMLLAEMAAEGCGILVEPAFILSPMIKAGRLAQVLQNWKLRTLPIHVVYPTRRHLSAKVQALTRFLSEWFTQHP